ncbi:karyogamy protein, partial [Tricharina praecox]|uniref:karyogamy protein n=1 Tax=Tricharina praecox TaxID=43433 RepID=UPI00222015C8
SLFSAQLSRLTSLSLPLSEDLKDRICKLATSADMCDALMSAGSQIGRWIDTAKKVLTGLDAEDDVEWAAQGRESLNEVDIAVRKFSGLINVYVELIDELQRRPDSDELDSQTLVDLVSTTEATVDGWRSIEELLKGVKDQVETAMEWTELWTTILQDIQAELDACQTLVFELEEKRHRSMMGENGAPAAGGSVDIDTLETIMEENPGMFPVANGKTATEIEDSSLLGLFARMQPISSPRQCDELESRRKQLERKWKKLNGDADSLKKELGEDRWVAIFRNAGKQATQMLDSIDRSMHKLKESVIAWEESGGSAIQRTFSIIGKGINDRFTVNGEIIRLDASLRMRWRYLEDQMGELDQTLLDLQLDTQALRDSISSLASLDITSGRNTPGSSPASSVQLNPSKPRGQERKRSPAPIRRPGSSIGGSPARRSGRHSSASSTPPTSPWGNSNPYSSMSMGRSISSPSAAGSYASYASYASSRTNKVEDGSIGHNFKPLTLTTPSPYRKVAPPTAASRRNSSSLGSRIPMPSPLSQENTPSPGSPNPRLRHQASSGRLRQGTPTPFDSNDHHHPSTPGSPSINVRPASAMASGRLSSASGRRSSMLPRPTSPGSKRMSLPFGAIMGPDGKPRWRH